MTSADAEEEEEAALGRNSLDRERVGRMTAAVGLVVRRDLVEEEEEQRTFRVARMTWLMVVMMVGDAEEECQPNKRGLPA